MNKLIELDKNLFVFLNNLGSEKWDFLWIFFSNKLVIFTFITIVVLIYIPVIEKKKWTLFIVFLIISIGVTDFLHVHLFKNVFMRLRPCWELELVDQIRPLIVDCGGQYGFISGHSANTSSMAIFIVLAFKSIKIFLKYILVIWVFIVSYSRIYLAKHYPLDVLFGILFGIFIGIIVYKIYNYFFNK
ncbi:MAG: phosphatase PAP2 family protein [Flavobacteriales bacterium]|nr:phosphatase PAP2 family protein [Flavobacteriales bacterium]|tara:strand:- start:7135 stop:7695 length:561 start_codon:yes stop_codon:yes gene_type:complete